MPFKWNSRAAAEFLKSQGVLAQVRARAERVAAAAGPGFEASSMIGRNRARASVRADTVPARVRNSRSNTLLRALEAGRGD